MSAAPAPRPRPPAALAGRAAPAPATTAADPRVSGRGEDLATAARGPADAPGAAVPREPAPCPAAPRIRGVGVVTGWGSDGEPGSAAVLGDRAGIVPAPTPVLEGDRFRRATRECLLAVGAARAAVADAGLSPEAVAGSGTGILFVSATGYAPANRAFLEDEGSTTLHFPYTSPSAVPGEVTIELGVRGPYLNLMGGGPATLHALWAAARWLADGAAARVLVLAVEVVQELRDLFARAGRLWTGPLVEGAACLVLEPGRGAPLRWSAAGLDGDGRTAAAVGSTLESVLAAERPRLVWSGITAPAAARAEQAAIARCAGPVPRAARTGEALALGPLLALARAHRLGADRPWLLTAGWRSDYGALLWPRD